MPVGSVLLPGAQGAVAFVGAAAKEADVGAVWSTASKHAGPKSPQAAMQQNA